MSEITNVTDRERILRRECDRLTAERDALAESDKRLREEVGNLQGGLEHYCEQWSEVCNENQGLLNELAALAAQEPLAHVVLTVSGVYRPATEVERRCSSGVFPIFAAAGAAPDLVKLITQLHRAKGRYHTQLAVCDLFDAVGLKNERPTK